MSPLSGTIAKTFCLSQFFLATLSAVRISRQKKYLRAKAPLTADFSRVAIASSLDTAIASIKDLCIKNFLGTKAGSNSLDFVEDQVVRL